MVEASGSLEVALKLAAGEAASAGYAEITPAHLMIALARLSEPDLAPQVDGAGLRSEFEQLGIDPRRFRRRLRALLGNGGMAPPAGGMHRSPECRAVFARAQAIAAQQAAPLGLVHLLQAALMLLAGGGHPGAGDQADAECPSCGKRASRVLVGGAAHCSACGVRVGTPDAGRQPREDEIPAEL